MNKDNQNKLLNIKNNCELNKDLRISELEKENAYLLIQVNKYKKQFAKIRPNETKKLKGKKLNSTIKNMSEKYNKAKRSHIIEKENLIKSANKYRNKMIEHSNRENFITKHFILNLGKEKFIEVMNRLDNPVKKSKIISKEKREKFLANDKYSEGE